MISVSVAAVYVNASVEDVQSSYDTAVTMVSDFLGPVTSCPVELQELAVLMGTARLFELRNSPNASVQWSPDGSTMAFTPKDPFTTVKSLLRKYKPIGGCG
ncbi:hypothetical protein [Actinoplanes derwentensis]|uniref:Uncharacterized protein n=1 Tax=Actinoplanes derwentensis TaxID=113562 RepID=A0A1H1V413_9ACTN|nr:hypothetical protein [Actinoplanes derwentensis]GID90516.1 hypothetical protein Ade03nite_94400 [Actinoplanes derwentensis]SDS79126.1 hypothetical protein SAMN04489716_1625 [Actinoplanes derwentensis]